MNLFYAHLAEPTIPFLFAFPGELESDLKLMKLHDFALQFGFFQILKLKRSS